MKNEIKNINTNINKLRQFGFIFGTIFFIITLYFFWIEKHGIWIYFTIGLLIILSAIFFPKILKIFYILWMTFAVILGWVMSRIILCILYYLILSPIGLISKLFGKKFLKLKFDLSNKSYWNIINENNVEKNDYEKQF